MLPFPILLWSLLCTVTLSKEMQKSATSFKALTHKAIEEEFVMRPGGHLGYATEPSNSGCGQAGGQMLVLPLAYFKTFGSY